ncbi:MAG: 4Fe-4S ferredoxin, partial [Clostridia bacterium]|nr:4Fe-4S ferredoxin [Clostridia bacterium]
MSLKKIALTELDRFFSAIALNKKIYLPVEKAGQYDYAPWEPGITYHPEVLHTVKSAKSVFFPQSEDLVRYKRSGLRLAIAEVPPEDEEFVVFGVHACDVKGFEVLDRVFLSDPVDTFYKARREHGTVVSVMCEKPEETCFCETFGIDAENPGADVQARISGGTLYMEALTGKGEVLLNGLGGIVTDAGQEGSQSEADEEAYAKAAEEHKKIMEKLP